MFIVQQTVALGAAKLVVEMDVCNAYRVVVLNGMAIVVLYWMV